MTINLEQRIANLSPQKRALLDLHLQQQQLPQRPMLPRHDLALPCPLSFSQQRLWLIQQLDPDNRAFHNGTAWQLSGRLDVDVLTRSLAEIIRRHGTLRTRLLIQEGEPVQCIDPPGPFHLPIIDLRGPNHTETRQRAQLQTLLDELIQRAYDFTIEVAWRFQLVQLADDEHVLIVAHHHIASDGWSVGIFQRELSLLYPAFAKGEASPLSPLAMQYVDFALWQRAQVQGVWLEKQLTYWQHQLQNLSVLQLPTDSPRAAVQSNAAATHEFIVPPPLTAALKALSKTQNATLYMTLLATFKILLFRYTGQQDLSVGAPIAGRNLAEAEALIGFFLNTLILRSQMEPDRSFLEFLAQVRQTTLDAYAHQDVPVEKLLERLHQDRTRDHTPPFQVLFLLQNMPRHPLALPDLTITPMGREVNGAVADIDCRLYEKDDQIIGRFTYRRTLFSPATISRLAGHYQTLLASVIANPACTIATLPLLTDAERRQLLRWNRTKVKYDLDKNLMTLFAEQVARRPQAIAFLTDDATLTYHDLHQRVNQLADNLCAVGVIQGAIVGVCLPRSFDAVVALLAIFKVGGVYLPLDPTYPSERLAFMLADAQAPFVVTNRPLRAILPATRAKLIDLDTLVAPSLGRPVSTSPCHPDDPAYIIYTSGSTGQPKGAIVPHRQILNRLWWMWTNYPLQTDEMSCQKTALNFVDSLWELLGPLLQGSPTVIPPDEVARDPQRLVQSLAKHGVTRLWVVPTLLRAMLQCAPDLGQTLSKLRFVVASGEALPTELMQHFQAQLPHAILYNLYGTSEVWDATWYDPTAEHNSLTTPSTSIPIGRPIANVETYILDSHLQAVPIGITGELYVGGAGLAANYLNRLALTAEKFISIDDLGFATDEVHGEDAVTWSVDSSGKETASNAHELHQWRVPGHRLYKTGDLARYLPDGNIEFLRRVDTQIKLRGFRIELGEIESALRQHPAVLQSVVVAREQPPSDPHLVAYVVLQPGITVTTAALRQALQQKLPAYMLPAAFIILDALPLTPSGKLDRNTLPAPERDQLAPSQQFVAARDALERQLTHIWENVLRVKPIGVQDNFFELGGHSLLAVQLFDRIFKQTGKQLPVATLFQAPTIEQVATLLRQAHWSPPWQSIAPMQPRGNKPPLFLAPPAGSTVLRFAHITRHLPTDQPVYGLEYLGMDGQSKPQDCIEEMAAYYGAEIRKLQPNPPYLLAGICFGAHLMLEVAQQFVAQGQPVALLAILDASAPAHGPSWRQPKRFSRGHMQMVREYWQTEGWKKWVQAHLNRQKNRWLNRIKAEKRHLLPVAAAHFRAQSRYQAKPYPNQICLIQSAEYAHRKVVHGRWRALAQGGLAYEMIAQSTHRTFLFQEPYTRHVAEQLTLHINQSLAQPSL